MFTYKGSIVKKADKYECDISAISDTKELIELLKKTHFDNESDATIWIDDEISRLTTGKGVWE